jgi:DNA-binding winged helix-turn-helix (wHTH) protein
MNPNPVPAMDPPMETDVNPERTQFPRYIRFGPFRIDQHRQQVHHNDTHLKLQDKVYQVLLVLLSRPNQVVTRDELKQTLWPSDIHVDFSANLNTAVNKLRQVLDDSTEKPLYIETVPRKGYIFLMEPEYSAQPFAQLVSVQSNGNSQRALHEANTPHATPGSDRWLTFGVIALILAGMLVGAGAAIFWLSHFAWRSAH